MWAAGASAGGRARAHRVHTCPAFFSTAPRRASRVSPTGHTTLSLQPSKNGTNPVDALYQAATLKSLLAANNVGVATGHTFTVYTRNTGR